MPTRLRGYANGDYRIGIVAEELAQLRSNFGIVVSLKPVANAHPVSANDTARPPPLIPKKSSRWATG